MPYNFDFKKQEFLLITNAPVIGHIKTAFEILGGFHTYSLNTHFSKTSGFLRYYYVKILLPLSKVGNFGFSAKKIYNRKSFVVYFLFTTLFAQSVVNLLRHKSSV